MLYIVIAYFSAFVFDVITCHMIDLYACLRYYMIGFMIVVGVGLIQCVFYVFGFTICFLCSVLSF